MTRKCYHAEACECHVYVCSNEQETCDACGFEYDDGAHVDAGAEELAVKQQPPELDLNLADGEKERSDIIILHYANAQWWIAWKYTFWKLDTPPMMEEPYSKTFAEWWALGNKGVAREWRLTPQAQAQMEKEGI